MEAAEQRAGEAEATLELTRTELAETQATSERRLQVCPWDFDAPRSVAPAQAGTWIWGAPAVSAN